MVEVVVWSGWVGGIGVGLYLLVQYWVTGTALGASTGYGNVCALGSRRPFFSSGRFADPKNWRLWFTLGLPLGGFAALMTSPGAVFEPTLSMGSVYETVFPASPALRIPLLLLGGACIGYGARMAGGCTSGHSITGTAMLNPPSMLASVGFFAGGVAIVQFIFNVL